MKISVHITTASGRIYQLTEKEGKTYITVGFWDGELVKLHQAIKLGNELEVSFNKINIFGVKDAFTTYMKTDRITELVVL